MSRIQKSICDRCGKEIPTNVSINVDGFNLRFGSEMPLSYLHNEDFCSVDCLVSAVMKLVPSFNKQMAESVKKVKANKK